MNTPKHNAEVRARCNKIDSLSFRIGIYYNQSLRCSRLAEHRAKLLAKCPKWALFEYYAEQVGDTEARLIANNLKPN